jgi:hypothetical protein
MKMGPNEVWIPLSMFIGLAVVLSLWVWFRYKAKKELQLTIRTAIEKGEGLSPELIENLVNPPVSPQRDLRRGVIGVLAAIGFALFGIILGEEDALRPLVGVAMFPLSIGIGFLLMHRFGRSA